MGARKAKLQPSIKDTMNENTSNKAAAAGKSPAASTADDELVSVYNKSPQGGDFVHEIYEKIMDEDGKRVLQCVVVKRWVAEAGKFTQVPRWLALLWKRQHPKAILDGDKVGQPSNALQVKDEKIRRLESQNQEYETRLKNMEQMVARLSSKTAA